jgi:hypothetical protein
MSTDKPMKNGNYMCGPQGKSKLIRHSRCKATSNPAMVKSIDPNPVKAAATVVVVR